ncbi:MAG: hypothetical protein Q7R97_04350 [Candidatus Daviesbacteria bacterium]|nr:hypothetical protein [Candidatus Daviesbacteria bacterium]
MGSENKERLDGSLPVELVQQNHSLKAPTKAEQLREIVSVTRDRLGSVAFKRMYFQTAVWTGTSLGYLVLLESTGNFQPDGSLGLKMWAGIVLAFIATSVADAALSRRFFNPRSLHPRP